MRWSPLAIFTLAWTTLSVTAGSLHWAFVPPSKPDIPGAEATADWARNPIDAFVLRQLRTEEMEEPNPVAAQSRLWRRLSLDLRGLPLTLQELEALRTGGGLNETERFMDRLLASPHYGERMAQDWLDLARYADTTGHAADQPRTMWLYRDRVIDALNADQPYDQFTIEQLAGDRLESPTEAQKIATGFHRNSMQALGNNPRKEEFRVRGIVDRLDVTGQIWLGVSLACAECHDHKHDPISQKEYHQLYAIFNQVPHYGEKFQVRGPRMTVNRVVHGKPTDVEAQIMDTLERPRQTYVHLRGNFETPGERVSPGLPKLFGTAEQPKDRLQFANWLVSEKQPLTARVAVNRAWQQLYGRGLVATANDLGHNGEKPTHPALLDWLAMRFQTEGWSTKRLHRDFLTSATYRQSSATTAKARNRDEKNQWLGRGARFRLSAEMLRDQALAVSGRLVDALGGPSVFPPQPEGVGEFRDATAGEWVDGEGADRYRRSLYTFWQRMSPHPAMTTFDAPTREWCSVTRAVTNTPLQALAMLNDPAMVDAQTAFARRLETVADGNDRLTLAFRLTLAREPQTEERDRWGSFLQKRPADERSSVLAAVLFNLDEFLSRE